MTPPRRPRPSSVDAKAIADAVAKQLPKAFPLPSAELKEIRDDLTRIDVRLKKIEDQNNEHLPLIKSLHSWLTVGKGFGKIIAWGVALAAASATAWTAIKALLMGTGKT